MVSSALLLAACGGGVEDRASEAPDRQAVLRLIEQEVRNESEDPNALQLADEAPCVANGLVEELGTDRLVELGLDVDAGTPPDLQVPPMSNAEADEVLAVFGACVDLVQQVAAALAGDAQPTSEVRCIAARYVDTQALRDALFSDGYDPEVNAHVDEALADAAAACAGS